MLNIVIVSLGRASLQSSTHCFHVLTGNATLGPSLPCKAASTEEFTQINTQVSEFMSHVKDTDVIKDTNTPSTLVSRDLKLNRGNRYLQTHKRAAQCQSG